MKPADLEDDVRHLRWPEPGPDLRARVLSAVVLVEHPVPWWDRVWFSRSWRLCAAGIVAALIVGESFMDRPAAEASLTTERMADVQGFDEVGRALGLPPEVAAVLAQRFTARAPAAGPADLNDRLRGIEGDR